MIFVEFTDFQHPRLTWVLPIMDFFVVWLVERPWNFDYVRLTTLSEKNKKNKTESHYWDVFFLRKLVWFWIFIVALSKFSMFYLNDSNIKVTSRPKTSSRFPWTSPPLKKTRLGRLSHRLMTQNSKAPGGLEYHHAHHLPLVAGTFFHLFIFL